MRVYAGTSTCSVPTFPNISKHFTTVTDCYSHMFGNKISIPHTYLHAIWWRLRSNKTDLTLQDLIDPHRPWRKHAQITDLSVPYRNPLALLFDVGRRKSASHLSPAACRAPLARTCHRLQGDPSQACWIKAPPSKACPHQRHQTHQRAIGCSSW